MILLLAALVLILGSLLFTLSVRAAELPQPEPESATAHLEERRAQIYENLRDLQFEFRVGKLSEADYQASKATLQQELAQLAARIESSTPGPKPKPAKSNVCSHCGAEFAQALKFCGECGRPMTEARG
jgi:NADH pyrophosphatase NudC (nudix superfamily)